MHDIINCISFSQLYQYANDTALAKVIRTTDDCKLLQRDIDSLQVYCRDKRLKFNVGKSVHVRINLPQKQVKTALN
jgi:hypothetical protein